MATKPIKTLKLPGLDDTYTFLQNDATLTVSGKAADAKATGDAITGVKSTVGESYYTELLRLDGYNYSGSAHTYDVDWHAGDTIRVDYVTNDPGRYLTIVAAANGTNTDYFLNTSSSQSSGSAEITLTANATQVKVFATLESVTRLIDIVFYKRHQAAELGKTLTECAAESEKTAAAVGDGFITLWHDVYTKTGVRLYDVAFAAGDVIKLTYSTNDPGANLAVVTADDEGTSLDTIINTTKRLSSGQKTVTLTQSASKLKLYCTYNAGSPYIDITVSKRIAGNMTLFERTSSNEQAIATLEERVGDVEEVAENAGADAQAVGSLVGDVFWEEAKRIDGFSVRGSTVFFDVDFRAGDVIKFSYTTNDPDHYLTVVTYVNDSNTDYFAQTAHTSASGESEVTITADATKIKVFTTFTSGLSGAHVDLLFMRRHTADDLDRTIVEQVVENKTVSSRNEASVDYVESEIAYGTLGEAMLQSNASFTPNTFMGIVMLDNNYKYFSVAQIKLIIDQMADVGLNYLELGFGGSGRGLGFALDDMTFTVRGKTYDMTSSILTGTGKYLSESDMEELIAYAASNGIEIIPSFNVISHASAILATKPEFWYRGAYNYSLDIDSRDACDYAVGLLEMYADWFAKHGCHHWNMCADEFSVELSTLQAAGDYHYADIINRVAYVLAKYRFVVHCWNDPICANESVVPHINRRLIVNYWAKKNAGYGSLTKIIADGHPVINANQSIYWVANSEWQVTEEQMRAFDITVFDGGYTYANPVGACFCIWIGNLEDPVVDDDGAAITTAVLPLIKAFGETIASQHS